MITGITSTERKPIVRCLRIIVIWYETGYRSICNFLYVNCFHMSSTIEPFDGQGLHYGIRRIMVTAMLLQEFPTCKILFLSLQIFEWSSFVCDHLSSRFHACFERLSPCYCTAQGARMSLRASFIEFTGQPLISRTIKAWRNHRLNVAVSFKNSRSSN